MSEVTYPLKTIARLLMVTERRVQQLVQEGKIPRASRGRYELVPAVQGYIRYLKDLAVNSEGGGGEAEDRRRLMKARADLAEFDARQRAGELVEVADFRDALDEVLARFRARSLGIPAKAAPILAAESDIERCRDIIETFVAEALAELSETEVVARTTSGAGGAGRSADGGAASEADAGGMG